MLERYEVETLLVLAEELHFGRTAERLRVSPARISQTISKLERRTGVPLFNRTSRRVELTPAGRRLCASLRPAWEQVTAAFEQAVATGRGLTGTLRIGFVGAAGGQLLAGAGEEFRHQHSDCDVLLREAQMTDLMPWLRDGEVDLALATFPFEDPGIVAGPVLVAEARLPAVPAEHPFARRASLRMEDLARVTLLQLPDNLPASLRADRTPRTTPSGKPIAPGPSASTFMEILTLVGAGLGVFPVGAQARRYHVRPDVAYVRIEDAPPLRWGLIWRSENATARVHAFPQAARRLVTDDR
ncbi:LysR family transcriptional regulator [Streptomyces qinglanensis]|uniref:DNA-binding transcriptional regulator, LysR family n=2 Tax=Streptomyces qinglanensis TaxID=943816 RepID=A0A1H9WG15_9ACTN|nr:LysR family transcriptional regulator [Streptomyces qinglanensis]SES32774.1 DNA-binding transcriptional regulator, LysR family [Streptomyces qinglanensis]